MKKNIFQLQMFGRYGKNAYLCSTRTPKPLYNAKIGGRFFIYTMTVTLTNRILHLNPLLVFFMNEV